MADGSHVAIEQIKVGDLVMSRDEFTGQTSVQRVKQTFERQADATLVLRLKNGEQIETTKEHPFYVESRGFTAAGEMGIGTSIVTRAGPNATLASSQVRNRAATVYNFEVENTHIYFVGQSELWVHNACFAKSIASHLKFVDNIIRGEVKGCHNLLEFSKLSNHPVYGNLMRIKSVQAHPNNSGILLVKYQIRTMKSGSKWPNLIVDYAGWATEKAKTLYNPSVISDTKYLDMVGEAFDEFAASGRAYSGRKWRGVTKDGVQMEGFVEDTTNQLITTGYADELFF